MIGKSIRSVNWDDKYNLGEIQLKNRVVLTSLTRQRCNPKDGIPNQLLVQYYTQRSGAGLILTKATSWSPRGDAFPGAGNIYTKQQAEGWRKVVDSVHKAKSKIFIQICHGGRAAAQNTSKDGQLWAPSALAIRDFNSKLQKQYPMPKQMSLQDIELTKKQFEQSIKLSKEAGFDGVQLHGAHGYLIDEFIRSQSNKRTDIYGGSAQNRVRFPLQLIDIATKYFQPYAVGIKLSPVSRYNDMYDQNPQETYGHLLRELQKRKIGFVELRESGEANYSKQKYQKSSLEQMPNVCGILRPYFSGTIIGNQGFNGESGIQKMNSGDCDLISFGRLFITNPDLPQRLIKKLEVNKEVNYQTWFGFEHGAKGYTDYPSLQLQEQKGETK